MLSYLHMMWITAKVNDSNMVNSVVEGIQRVVIGACHR
jgi:hypothetical protein